jgi:hypothetical protein
VLGRLLASSRSRPVAQPRARIPRSEVRRTPPLALVGARLECGPDQVLTGQLWDISRAGAALCLPGAAKVSLGQKARLVPQLRHGTEEVAIPVRVRWVDGRPGWGEGPQTGAGSCWGTPRRVRLMRPRLSISRTRTVT